MKTIATFMNAHEAHLLRIKLEDSGIPAIVCDEITAGTVPHLTIAIGGIKVQVSDEDFGKAQAVLLEETPLAGFRDNLTCPKCRSTNIAQALHEKRSFFISFLFLLLTMIPLPIVERRYRCDNCNHVFE